MKSDIIDITLHLHARSERAVLVSDDGEKANAVWLPLSQIEIEMTNGATCVGTMPAWLALEKGLI